MFARRTIVLLLLIVSGCAKDQPIIDPFVFLTAHIWKSTNYGVKEKQGANLEEYLAFHKESVNSNITFYPGDTLKYVVTFELIFTDANILKETRNYKSYYKCSQCDSYVSIGDNDLISQNVFLINSEYLFVTAHDVSTMDTVSNDTHRYRLISNTEMVLDDWLVIKNNIPDEYDLIVNGIRLQTDEELNVDVTFKSFL